MGSIINLMKRLYMHFTFFVCTHRSSYEFTKFTHLTPGLTLAPDHHRQDGLGAGEPMSRTPREEGLDAGQTGRAALEDGLEAKQTGGAIPEDVGEVRTSPVPTGGDEDTNALVGGYEGRIHPEIEQEAVGEDRTLLEVEEEVDGEGGISLEAEQEADSEGRISLEAEQKSVSEGGPLWRQSRRAKAKAGPLCRQSRRAKAGPLWRQSGVLGFRGGGQSQEVWTG